MRWLLTEIWPGGMPPLFFVGIFIMMIPFWAW
jgi:hypothetical protein